MLKSGNITKQILKVGTGTYLPTKIDLVKIKYTGYFSDTFIQFDSTNDQAILISLNDETFIKGFKIGLETMKKNEIANININSIFGFTLEESLLKIPDDFKERRNELSQKNIQYIIEVIDFVKRRDISEMNEHLLKLF